MRGFWRQFRGMAAMQIYCHPSDEDSFSHCAANARTCFRSVTHCASITGKIALLFLFRLNISPSEQGTEKSPASDA